MALQTGPISSAGAKLHVVANAALPATENEAGYEALTFVECGYITDIPGFGESYNINSINILGSGLVIKAKGSCDPGTIAVPMARTPADPGQAILDLAKGDMRTFSFKVTLADDFTPVTGHPTTAYFMGKVSGYPIEIGSTDGFVMSTVNIAITSKPVISVAE